MKGTTTNEKNVVGVDVAILCTHHTARSQKIVKCMPRAIPRIISHRSKIICLRETIHDFALDDVTFH